MKLTAEGLGLALRKVMKCWRVSMRGSTVGASTHPSFRPRLVGWTTVMYAQVVVAAVATVGGAVVAVAARVSPFA